MCDTIRGRLLPVGRRVLPRRPQLVVEALHLGVLARVHHARLGQLALEHHHTCLRGLKRRGIAARRQKRHVRCALRHPVDLPLDHRETILFAAQGCGVRLQLLAQAGKCLEVRLRLFRQLGSTCGIPSRGRKLGFELIQSRLA